MRAARCVEYGPPESVVIETVPDPVAQPGQVVVDVRYAAVNFPDVLLVANRYQVPVPLPFTPGSEFAGVVRAVGDGVVGVAAGDHVFGSTMMGAFAEQVVVPAPTLTRVPDGVDLRSAAAFGVAHSTAYHALRSVAEVQPGEWVLVLGAAGGVGLAAVELATALGARVVAAAGGVEKLELCVRQGAVATVDYSCEDLKNRVKEITGGGAGVVIDPVGGAYSEAALRATRFGSRFVVVGFASGEIPRIPLNLVLLKGTIVRGFEMRTFFEHEPERAQRDAAELLALLAAGKVRPFVSTVHPLAETPRALRSMLDRTAMGKVLIDVGN
ncbi:MAG: NADPH:quinone oxidoreductase family protein [Acidimicrobiia bacterium]